MSSGTFDGYDWHTHGLWNWFFLQKAASYTFPVWLDILPGSRRELWLFYLFTLKKNPNKREKLRVLAKIVCQCHVTSASPCYQVTSNRRILWETKHTIHTFWTETLQGHSFNARIADGQMSVNPPRSPHILSDTDPGSGIGPHYPWSGAINTGFNVNNLAYIAKNMCFTGHFSNVFAS